MRRSRSTSTTRTRAWSHNVAIKDGGGAEVFQGEIFPGVATKDYDVAALDAGTYKFVCSVHANMTGITDRPMIDRRPMSAG